MKKILFALPLLSLCFVACDPAEEEAPAMPKSVTSQELGNMVTIEQVVANQNKFRVTTSPSMFVHVCNQDGALLASGTDCEIIGIPPLTEISVKVRNLDGTEAVVKKSVTIKEYVDVPEIYSNLFGSEFTQQVWTWDETGDAVMGNGAYMEGTADFQNRWWNIAPADLQGQCEEKGLPNDGLGATMTFILAGQKFETSSGRKGTLSWDLTNIVKEGWSQGKLTFTGSFPLLGIQFNGGNAPFNEYDILYMDGEKLCICAPEPGAGDWGTAWFWNYAVKK